jgi:hypothetical protein
MIEKVDVVVTTWRGCIDKVRVCGSHERAAEVEREEQREAETAEDVIVYEDVEIEWEPEYPYSVKWHSIVSTGFGAVNYVGAVGPFHFEARVYPCPMRYGMERSQQITRLCILDQARHKTGCRELLLYENGGWSMRPCRPDPDLDMKLVNEAATVVEEYCSKLRREEHAREREAKSHR